MLALGMIGTLLSIALIMVSFLLIGLVLLQKNRGSGLSGAFGGVGGHSAFGTKTGDFLTWVTVGMVTLFILLNIAGNYAFEPAKSTSRQTAVQPSPSSTGSPTPAQNPSATNPPSPAPPVGTSPAPTSGDGPNAPSGSKPAPTGQ